MTIVGTWVRAAMDRAAMDRVALDRAALDRAALDGAARDGAEIDRAALDHAAPDPAENEPARTDAAETDPAGSHTVDPVPAGADGPAAPPPAGDEGMTTAEYAIGTVAAAAFAGLLLRILTSPAVEHVLANAFNRAFSYLYQ